MTKTQKLSTGIIIGLAVVIGVLLGASYISKSLGANPVANTSGFVVDLVGSQTGTTTAPVSFFSFATTTYPFRIRPQTDTVTLTLLATEASSSGATVNLSILSSNDMSCDTASTSPGTLNTTVTGQIKWYDAGLHIRELAGSSALNTGTSTITWSPTAGTGKEITLTDTNSQCLALQVNASSTKLLGQFITK